MSEESTPSYEAAVEEIEAILEAIEDGQLPIDALAPKVERATALLKQCRDVLTHTELRVTEAVDALVAATDASGQS
jgi:exodeoxyribonuclease VII small subunit